MTSLLRGRTRAAVLAGVMLAWCAAAARADGPSLAAGEQMKVNEAIVQGVQYLKQRQFPVGHWGSNNGANEVSYAALPALTLLECGVPARHSVVQKAAEFVRRATPNLSATYDIALAVLFLDRLGESEDRPIIRALATRLIAGQTVSGGWSYGCPVLSAADQQMLLSVLRGKPYVPPLPAAIRSLAVLQRGGIPDNPPGTDNSNTHFAILAVWTAQRYDLPVKRTMALVARRFVSSQNKDGGWGYEYKRGGGVQESPPMICAGLLGLAIGEGLLQDIRARPA